MLFSGPDLKLLSSGQPSSLTQSLQLGKEIATLANTALPLMKKHGIALKFSQATESGLVIANATCNPTAAYKIRGALASAQAALHLGKKEVCTASAGNHGAGLAYAAQCLGMHATIFVPTNSPSIKIERIKGFGARVIKQGESFDECLSMTRGFLSSTDHGSTTAFVHPFDEEVVIAGQGTIGLEILEHLGTLKNIENIHHVRVFVPIGGGGLAGGVASALKHFWPQQLPPPEIIGVIDESSPAALLGTYFGRPVRALPDTIADGTRVALVGNSFISLAPLIDRILLVPHDRIVETMRSYHSQTGEMLEPSGALALAGESFMREACLDPQESPGVSFAIISGRNVDPENFNTLLSQKARLDLSQKTRIAFDVAIEERPGQLRIFLEVVKEFNITSLTYKQRPNPCQGTLRAEFEIDHSQNVALQGKILSFFPGSVLLNHPQNSVFQVGAPVAHQFRDELVTLDDNPGSFLEYIRAVEKQDSIGSVGFLFYRKPASQGARAQVVIGRSTIDAER